MRTPVRQPSTEALALIRPIYLSVQQRGYSKPGTPSSIPLDVTITPDLGTGPQAPSMPGVRIEKVRGSIPLSSTIVCDLRLVVTTVSLREPQTMIRIDYSRLFQCEPRSRAVVVRCR
jgi:hypothetical protein